MENRFDIHTWDHTVAKIVIESEERLSAFKPVKVLLRSTSALLFLFYLLFSE